MNTVNEWTRSGNGTMAALEAERNRLALQHEQDIKTIDELRDAYLEIISDPDSHTKRRLEKTAKELDAALTALHQIQTQVEVQIKNLGLISAVVPDSLALKINAIRTALRSALAEHE